MSTAKVLKSFTVGSASVSLIETDHFDPNKKYVVEIEGSLPGRFAGLPQSTMLRIARALAMLARQSASYSYADLNQWASELKPKEKQSSDDAKDKGKKGRAATVPPTNSAASGTARTATA